MSNFDYPRYKAQRGKRTFYVQPVSILGWILLGTILGGVMGFGWPMILTLLAVLMIEMGTAYKVRVS